MLFVLWHKKCHSISPSSCYYSPLHGEDIFFSVVVRLGYAHWTHCFEFCSWCSIINTYCLRMCTLHGMKNCMSTSKRWP